MLAVQICCHQVNDLFRVMCGSFDSSVGRAVDCRGVMVIHRSVVRIRLEGLIF